MRINHNAKLAYMPYQQIQSQYRTMVTFNGNKQGVIVGNSNFNQINKNYGAVRASSVPIDKKINQDKVMNNSHIRIEGESQTKRQRKFRIFQQSGRNHSPDKNNQKRNRSVSIFENSKKYSAKAEDTSKPLQKQPQSLVSSVSFAVQEAKKDNALISALMAKTLIKPSEILQQKELIQQLKRRQQQVQFLKLQLQRYKRCDSLSKNNELMYKKIMQKLSIQAQSVNHLENKIKEEVARKQKGQKKNFDNQAATPIQSLQDVKIDQERNSKRNNQQTWIPGVIKKNSGEVSPKQHKTSTFIEQHNQKQNSTHKFATMGNEGNISSQIKHNHLSNIASQAITFNQKQTKKQQPAVYQSSRFHAEQLDSNMIKIQQKYYNTRRINKNMGEVPIARRLQEMNRVLESNIVNSSKYRPNYSQIRVNSTFREQSIKKAKMAHTLNNFYINS